MIYYYFYIYSKINILYCDYPVSGSLLFRNILISIEVIHDHQIALVEQQNKRSSEHEHEQTSTKRIISPTSTTNGDFRQSEGYLRW